MKLNYEKSGSQGPVFLLGHGFPFDHTMWNAQIADLSKDFIVIAPDFRGMGKSSPSGSAVTSMEELADDLAELLDDIQIKKCSYCGLSMGGYVGWEFWLRHPQRLESFILCDSNAKCDTPDAAQNRLKTADRIEAENSCAFMAEIMKKNLMTNQTLASAESTDSVFSRYRKMVTENNPSGVASVARGMAQRKNFTNLLQTVQIPMLVLAGELDLLSPPEAMKELTDAIPNAQLALIPNAAHLAPMEQPESVNQAIRQFLNSIPSEQ